MTGPLHGTTRAGNPARPERFLRLRLALRPNRAFPVLAVATFLLAGCNLSAGTLRVAETVALPDATAVTLSVDADGSFWLGRPGGLLRLPSATGGALGVNVGPLEPMHLLGTAGPLLLFRSSDGLAAVGEEGLVAEAAAESDSAALDPVGEYLLTATENGTIVAYRAHDLAPVWGWPAVGAPANALEFTPEGDRVYQPGGPFEYREHPVLLVRDIQTGRIVREFETPGEIVALVAGSDDTIYGVWTGGGRVDAEAFALGWRGGAIVTLWTHSLADLDLEPPLRIVLAPSARSLALAGTREGTEETAGLHLLDVETGRSSNRYFGPFLDLAFDHLDRLWLLHPGELRRME